jgi:hypothetical protein
LLRLRLRSLGTVVWDTKANSQPKTTAPENGSDSGWLAYLAAVKSADPEIEDNYGLERIATDYAMLPTKVLNAAKFATGHKSEELFRIGYMLLIVREWNSYTLADLAHVVSSNWVMPTDDLDLIDRVRDTMASSCRFAEDLHQSKFPDFVKHVDRPREVRDFMRQLEDFRTLPRDRNRSPILGISDFKVILCAEIWCTWAHESQSPLPSRVDFVELFGPGIAAAIKLFVRRLATGIVQWFLGWIVKSIDKRKQLQLARHSYSIFVSGTGMRFSSLP